jgi:hypothetical protein
MRASGAAALTLGLLFALAAAPTVPLAAHAAGPAKVAPANYAPLNKLPDWRGIWLPARAAPGAVAEAAVPTAEYKARTDAYRKALTGKDTSHGINASNCLPPGMPLIMTQPYDLEFLFSPDRVTIVQEAYMQVRRVFTDGRPQPPDPDPNFNGHSIGHWEGGTLVAETIGVRDDTILGRPSILHSDQLVITERIHLDKADPDKLVIESTFTDPKALAQPWHTVATFIRHREWEQIEFICAENDRNPITSEGKTATELRN